MLQGRNSPQVNVDSLIQVIETRKGQPLDKITRTNFRLRNTWPDKINLKLTADVFSNKSINKYSDIELSIDNSTGYTIDNAVVQLTVWEKNKANEYRVSNSDAFRFANIGYVSPSIRKIRDSYRGDSISVSFSIRSKALNFSYLRINKAIMAIPATDGITKNKTFNMALYYLPLLVRSDRYFISRLEMNNLKKNSEEVDYNFVVYAEDRVMIPLLTIEDPDKVVMNQMVLTKCRTYFSGNVIFRY